jgi:ribosomal protein S18 acetylase RimI-like enzyme
MAGGHPVDIRDADEGDVGFIAWVMLAASRSHLPRGIWEYINDQDEEQTLAFLRRIAVSDEVHLFHLSLFQIAEVDGTPAAAMCGYDSATQGMSVAGAAVGAAAMASGVVFDESFTLRAGRLGNVVSDNAEGSWVIENVATRPEFRRRGLTDALIKATLDRGRDKGFALGQISVFIGNEPARQAYLKAGFEVKDEKRDAEFEADMGSPGFERMLQPL